MNIEDPKKAWEVYCAHELELVSPILAEHGIVLDTEQPHIAGERYLMQAVTTASGRKLILLGNKVNGEAREGALGQGSGQKVIIKATRDAGGKREIERERLCRSILARIDFAGETFHTPAEILFLAEKDFLITVTEFIDQECSFLERPLEEQFGLALRAFKGQESAHATTWNHRAVIGKVFGIRTVATYLHTFGTFKAHIIAETGDSRQSELIERAESVLRQEAVVIDQYTGFLTHTDFVPHNIRVKDDTIYLLDHSSLTFGNKYEGWARFLNFMTLYNPALEDALLTYVAKNRTSEETRALRAMRIYRLGEIIWYYIQAAEKSTGNLRELNAARIEFWSDVLACILDGEKIPDSVRTAYTRTRDALRSEDEKRRQQGLH